MAVDRRGDYAIMREYVAGVAAVDGLISGTMSAASRHVISIWKMRVQIGKYALYLDITHAIWKIRHVLA